MGIGTSLNVAWQESLVCITLGKHGQEKWDFVERCMAGKPRMYNSWKTWARECDDRSKNSAFYDEEEDENVGSDALGCYLFPQAPKCRQWDMSDDDDDVGYTHITTNTLSPEQKEYLRKRLLEPVRRL